MDAIKKVAGIIANIASASIEQASGIEQVNKALAQMDEVTQQNSALVEENAATAKTLEHQAKAMDERVAFFRLDQQPDSAPAAKRASATYVLGVTPPRRLIALRIGSLTAFRSFSDQHGSSQAIIFVEQLHRLAAASRFGTLVRLCSNEDF